MTTHEFPFLIVPVHKPSLGRVLESLDTIYKQLVHEKYFSDNILVA
jgi:hypothetical protein